MKVEPKPESKTYQESLLAYVNPIRNAKLHDRYLIGVMKGLRPEGLTKLVDPFDL